jgi:hypothetical protein
MPIHLKDLDVVSEVAGLRSALLVPCNMCAAASVAVREDEPFIQFFRHFFKSAPMERYLRTLQSRLGEAGVDADVFKCNLPHQWFLCMCPEGRRKKLENQARDYDAAIVLGCDSAVRTVRDAARSADCKVVRGMEVAGIMNTRPRFRLPGNLSFEGCRIMPILHHKKKEDITH